MGSSWIHLRPPKPAENSVACALCLMATTAAHPPPALTASGKPASATPTRNMPPRITTQHVQRCVRCSPIAIPSWTGSSATRLAATEYHRGDNAQCLAVLFETTAITAQRDASLILPPCDADNYVSTSKAILYNQMLRQAPGKH
jgi:hypothetical protein